MKIGLFGGTFDPIHLGHIALAKAARDRFDLGRVLFVPTGVPPHKKAQPTASFCDRYAMVVLGTMEEKTFVASQLEAPCGLDGAENRAKSQIPSPNYSINTVRRLKQQLRKSDQLFFLIGMDAFEDIAKWHESEALLRECEFIVASRPGYSLADVANALPASVRPAANVTKPFAKQAATGDLVLPGATIHLLEGVSHPASATAVRQALKMKKSAARFLNADVAEYIRKMKLYGT